MCLVLWDCCLHKISRGSGVSPWRRGEERGKPNSSNNYNKVYFKVQIYIYPYKTGQLSMLVLWDCFSTWRHGEERGKLFNNNNYIKVYFSLRISTCPAEAVQLSVPVLWDCCSECVWETLCLHHRFIPRRCEVLVGVRLQRCIPRHQHGGHPSHPQLCQICGRKTSCEWPRCGYLSASRKTEISVWKHQRITDISSGQWHDSLSHKQAVHWCFRVGLGWERERWHF